MSLGDEVKTPCCNEARGSKQSNISTLILEKQVQWFVALVSYAWWNGNESKRRKWKSASLIMLTVLSFIECSQTKT